MQPIAGLVLLAGVAVARVQQLLTTPSFPEAETNVYQFDWPIRRVAIIGAGLRFFVCPPHHIVTYALL